MKEMKEMTMEKDWLSGISRYPTGVSITWVIHNIR